MNESTRRKVNLDFDQEPSFHHKFNLDFALSYIKNKKVLDIGCWTGQFEKLAVKHSKEIWGIDPGVEAIKIARRLVPKAKFKVGDALNLEFKDNYFDTVTILDVIEHIPKATEEKCLNEVKRVLRPNGFLVISTPYAHPLSYLLDPAFFLIGHRHYSAANVKKMLFKSGFKPITIERRGGILRMGVAILESLFKHVLKSKLHLPNIVNKFIKYEAEHAKIAELYVIAQSVN